MRLLQIVDVPAAGTYKFMAKAKAPFKKGSGDDFPAIDSGATLFTNYVETTDSNWTIMEADYEFTQSKTFNFMMAVWSAPEVSFDMITLTHVATGKNLIANSDFDGVGSWSIASESGQTGEIVVESYAGMVAVKFTTSTTTTATTTTTTTATTTIPEGTTGCTIFPL
ncbi:unnamed protein product [Polarella glacialis]|uniref:Uncharacterized protein n=1 Tax=Polarella glacialis TaxID=89957 RepID=A0A813E417_POLGL|nr:unnamed protein product [Polarella glacialis]